jgi:hypothetical protein
MLRSAPISSKGASERTSTPHLKKLEIYFSCAAPSPSRPISSSSRATRASVLNKAEAKPALSLPTPPPELSDDAKVEWGRVSEEPYRVGLLSKIDCASLAAYCQAYGRWMQADRALTRMSNNDPVSNGGIERYNR